MKLKITTIMAFILALSLISSLTSAAPSCKAQYFGDSPKILKEKLSSRTTELCYEGYATKFSGITRTPLWSAEHLTKIRVKAACAMHRKDAFHADKNLPENDRSELEDYRRSGYDRGHMAPSGDMPTPSAQAESFSLANMAPQLHADNAGIWEKLENGTRNLAYSGHDVYVVSGPLFEGATLKQLNGRVMVPTGFYKAVYDGTTKQAGVFVTKNTKDQTVTFLTVDELAKRAGIDVFPSLSAAAKATKSEVIHPANRTECEGR